MQEQHARRPREKGNVLLVTALSASVILGCLGLCLDGGMIYLQKRKIQSAADAAAMGAALEKTSGGSTNAVIAAGKADSALNGFDGAAGDVAVMIDNPPAAGPRAGDTSYIEATVTKQQPTNFMRYFGFDRVTISARAETMATDAAGGCIYVMDNSSSEDAFRIDGTFQSDCGVYSNSVADKSLNKAGGTAAAPFFKTRGGWTGTFGAVPTRSAAPVADPLAGMVAPTWGAVPKYYNTAVSADSTLNPGIYHGGIAVARGVHAKFNPGLYVISGGKLYGAGAPDTWLSGAGVTFYFTAANGGSPSDFLLDGGGRVTFSAPEAGANRGILFMQDRAHPGGAFDIQGTGVSKLEGILYFPRADFLYQNQTRNEAAYTVIVCKTLRLAGNGPNLRVRANYDGIGGSPIRTAPVFSN